MTLAEALERARRRGVTASDETIALARLVLAIAGVEATPPQTRTVLRRLSFARWLYVQGRVNEFGGPRGDPPQNRTR
jgi:hypothetical protein